MIEFLRKLFATDFMPHVYCLRLPEVIWLHVLSDAAIAASYFFIPLALVLLIRRRKDLAFSWMFALFGVFILACGTTHILAIWTLWHPIYRFDGMIKAVTALASMPTAVLLFRLLPKAVALPSPAQLRAEVSDRQTAEERVRQLNAELEQRVQARTRELEIRNRQLYESDARFRAAVAAVSDIIWTNNAEGRMTGDQPGWSAFTGQTPEDYQDYGWARVVHPEDSQPTLDAWNQAVTERARFQFEHRVRRHDGTWRVCSVRAMPVLDESGQVREWVGVHRDVTEERRAQDELQRAKVAAEAASRAKSAFLANMSHELRTPLNAILGYSEMLYEEAHDAGHEAFIPDLQKIQSAGKHLLSLINSVLDLSKIEAGKMELTIGTFPLEQLLQEVATVIQPIADAYGNRLILQVSGGLETITADQTKLRQTLLNLLSNACKFTKEGTVTLEARLETTRLHGESILFTVVDTGIGIAADQLGRLFEPFVQADMSTSRSYGGTGLGLAISRRFVEMMGGSLEAESQPGKGSRFTVRLPVRRQGSTVAVKREQSAETFGSYVVLAIDDEPDVHELLRRALMRNGFHVESAYSGEEGLQKARELRPDAITLDVMMPGMDGWTVLHHLKADPELCATPVVMLTILDNRNLGYSLGATDYLSKPINRTQLISLLTRYAHQQEGRVLVVDDEADNRTLLQRLLEAEGWRVETAADGADALKRVAEQRPQVILLDLMMPVMDGFGFLSRLREIPASRNIPVIVVTAKDLSAQDKAWLDGQVSAILQKGHLDTEDLLGNVREWLELHAKRGMVPGRPPDAAGNVHAVRTS